MARSVHLRNGGTPGHASPGKRLRRRARHPRARGDDLEKDAEALRLDFDEYDVTPPDPVEPPDAEDALSPAEVGDALRGGSFNPDLFDHLPLPWRPATHEVVAELAGRKSNVVRVRLEEVRPD